VPIGIFQSHLAFPDASQSMHGIGLGQGNDLINTKLAV
jgi:hypothetical protein